MSSTAVPLLPQAKGKKPAKSTIRSSFGGVEQSYTDSSFHQLSGSHTADRKNHTSYQSEQTSSLRTDSSASDAPSFLYILFIFVLGCIVILSGFVLHGNLFFDVSERYTIDSSYLLLFVSFGIAFISYSLWTVAQLYFNCCIKTYIVNFTGFTIFFLVLGLCLLTLSVIGFLDEYLDAYDAYEVISYPIYVIFILFGSSIGCLLIAWVHVISKERRHKVQHLKEFYFQKMLQEEGDAMDYNLPANRDKLPSYIQKNGILHPYDRSVFSLIWETMTHCWLFSIIYLGTQRTLQSYDMYLPPKSDDIEYNMDKWLKAADELKQKYPEKQFSSFQVLWRIERNSFCVRFAFMTLATLSGLIVPPIIGELADFYEDDSIATSYGVYLCIALLLAGVVRIELAAIVFTLAGRCVARVRALLTYAIYHKAINMSISASSTDSELSSGQKITLIAADTRIIAFAMGFEPMFFANVVLIVMVCVFLHLEIGVSALAGWLVMIFVSGPIQGVVGKKVQVASKNYIFQSDSRIKFIGELVRGIRVTKMYSWEHALMNEIDKYRTKEMDELLVKIKFISVMSMINVATPQFMALIMFGVYVLLGNTLSLRTVFAVITLIQLIRISIRILPFAVMLAVGAAVGFNRLNTFFRAKEQKDMLYFTTPDQGDTASEDSQYMVYMENATFKWPKVSKKKDKKEGKKSKKKNKEQIQEESDGEDEEEEKKQQAVEIVATEPGKDYAFLLENISMKLEKGKLYALIGSVGSGKSSLIQAILREMQMIDGVLKINNGDDQPIGYVAQTAFIMNDTVRANILWGLPFDDEFYNEVLAASSLSHDLSILANGDLTEIGERGINLSGGQKARISFARALYRSKYNANMYLLDDPLSAVDVNVGNNMFHRGIKQLLKNKTILLVINSHLHLLQFVDEILIIDKGRITVQDSYEKVLQNQEYAHLLPDPSELASMSDTSSDPDSNAIKSDLDASKEVAQDDRKTDDADKSYSVIKRSLRDKQQTETQPATGYGATDAEAQKRGKLTTKEDRKSGTVAWSVYNKYFANAVNIFNHNDVINGNVVTSNKLHGISLIVLEVVLLVLAQTFVSGSDIWLAFWAEEAEVNRFPSLPADSDWWLIIWSLFIAALTVLTFYSSYLFGWLSIRAAQSLHMKVLYCVLRAPLLYFDSTPTGRILNRFSKDTNEMDSDLVMHFTNFAQQALQVLGYLIVIMVSVPYTILPLLVVVPLLYYLQKYYRMSSADIKRLDQVTTTPIIAQYSETLMGVDTIRAYKTSETIFLKNIRKKIRLNHKISLGEHMGIRWFGTYMDLTIMVLLLCITLFATFFRSQFEPALLALAVVYGYAMMGMMQWAIRTLVDVEKAFTAVERLLYYEKVLEKNKKKLEQGDSNEDGDDKEDEQTQREDEITSEAQEINYQYRPPNAGWPNAGKIVIKDLRMRYRKDLDLVLDGLSITIESGEKIGVCGRTGAGKSSLLLTLFRLVEPEMHSVIEIDDIDCLRLGLRDLRKSLAIIPQEPVLFSGTLRFNLDPFEEFDDEEVWDALKKCELYEFVYEKPEKLNFEVSEGGANFSAGQKQLICIGRALLKRSKVLLLDEATSSIDKHTDSLIQTLIRKEFVNVTVICIAHRLETIIDYDRVLVLANGNIQEFDTPTNLLNKGAESVFYQMVNSAHKDDEQSSNKSGNEQVDVIEEEEEEEEEVEENDD